MSAETPTVGEPTEESTGVVEALAAITRWVGIAVVIFGGLLAEGSTTPVLPVEYSTVLAAGAVILAASAILEVRALRERIGA